MNESIVITATATVAGVVVTGLSACGDRPRPEISWATRRRVGGLAALINAQE